MKKLNKPICLALALTTCLCLAGCGKDSEVNTPNNQTSTNTGSVNNSISTAENSVVVNNGEVDTSSTEVTLEPAILTVTDITADETAGYGFHVRNVYGNAFGLVYSYGSVDGSTINNATIMVIPVEMTDIDEILATEYCQNIKKEELTETEIDGVTGWISTEEASQTLVEACESLVYDELYVQMKVSELAAAGVSDEDALNQAMNNLAAVGLGDAG